MRNIGSISDQTIGGLISTASHGSGVTFPVLSRHVKSMRLALPLEGAPVVEVSETEDSDLFKATLCGLGATGLILEVEIEVEEAFRLRETKTPFSVDAVLDNLDTIKSSAEHVRVWWYPDGQGMIVGRANRVYEVSHALRSLADTVARRTEIFVHGPSPWLSPHTGVSAYFALHPSVHSLGRTLGVVACERRYCHGQ